MIRCAGTRRRIARFPAENGLFMHPSGVAVTLQDCTELAPKEGTFWATCALAA
jgi:hypothetical protein